GGGAGRVRASDWAGGLVGPGGGGPGGTPWGLAPSPPEDPDEPFVVPQTLNVHHGIVVVENLRLGEIASAGVHEFLLVISHAKLRGATGAWVAPLAIV